MTIDVWINKFSGALSSFSKQTGDILKIAARDAKDMIQTRVQRDGLGGECSFTPYGDQWAKVRQKKGYQVGHKDFTFSGSMWNETDILSSSASTVILGTKGEDQEGKSNRVKAEGHLDRERQAVLSVTDKEKQQIIRFVQNRITKIFR